MASTLDPVVFTNGAWFAKGSSPPDKAVPSACPPPGVTSPGCWVCVSKTVGYVASAAHKQAYSHAVLWMWCPLPLGQVVLVQGPGGVVVPTIAVCGLQTTNATDNANTGNKPQAVYLGPWLQTQTQPTLAGPWQKVVIPAPVSLNPPPVPTADPSGWSGGTWTKVPGYAFTGIWVYDNGQVSSGSVLPWVLGGAAAVAAGAAAFLT
jgi:hypothetical protein